MKTIERSVHQAATTQTYRDVERMLHDLAWRYGRDQEDHEDLMGVANEAYANAYLSYDPRKGASFLTWAYICVRNALVNEHRQRIRRSRVCHHPNMDGNPDRRFDLRRFCAELSNDGRLIVQAVVNSPEDFVGPGARNRLIGLFRSIGWGLRRIIAGFREIHEVLIE